MGAYGWTPSRPDHRDWTLVDPHAPAKLPSTVSLRHSPNMPAVYDQGQLGSCTANAIAGAYEFELRRQGEDFMPSRLWIYYQERMLEGTVDQDAGAALRDGLKVVGKIGVCPEADWPYDITTFTGPPPSSASTDAMKSHAVSYYSLNMGRPGAPLRSCLAAGFPFVFGFSVTQHLESGEMAAGRDKFLGLPARGEGFVGGHAVMAIGYDWTCSKFRVPVFEIRNSWGDWCDAGCFFIDARYFGAGLADDIWTVRQTT